MQILQHSALKHPISVLSKLRFSWTPGSRIIFIFAICSHKDLALNIFKTIVYTSSRIQEAMKTGRSVQYIFALKYANLGKLQQITSQSVPAVSIHVH